jgi:hypothetical protein
MARPLINLVGKKFGKITVLNRLGTNQNKKPTWDCKCDCGNFVMKTTTDLIRPKLPNCGCTNTKAFNDLTGKKVNKLTVIKQVEGKKDNCRLWLCKCECGNEKILPSNVLSQNKIRSCGCLSKTHGHTRNYKISSEYHSWYAMKRRCNNPSNSDYPYYGGRGIKYPNSWNDFTLFIKDMGKKPDETYTLDRINPNEDYSKENCRWVSRLVQSNNKRVCKNNSSGYKNIQWFKPNKRWIVVLTVKGVRKQIGSFIDKKEALNNLNRYIIQNNLKEIGYYIQKWEG